MLNLASSFLSVNSRIKWLLYALVICPSALPLRRRLGQNAVLVCRILPAIFLHKLALVTCPCTFLLRRLAQNVRRLSGVRHFSWKFPRTMALVTCLCAFRVRRLAQNVGLSFGLRPFPCKFKRKMKMDLVTCPRASRRLRRLAQNVQLIKWDLVQALVARSCGDPGGLLSSPKGPCMILRSFFEDVKSYRSF